MASHRRTAPPDGDGKPPSSPADEVSKNKDGREQSEMVSPTEEEIFSWPGPKNVILNRAAEGFGFTLRHFIVYPPESAVQSTIKDEENGNRGGEFKGRPRNRLEPMDTIFVKQVREGGPAHLAGLCTGDRIIKVNGESIIGKTYSQVIAVIQNSDSTLELSVMPKDEDILQLLQFPKDGSPMAYSQDAYRKGNEAYSGKADHIPEPPPICYPRRKSLPSMMAQPADIPPPDTSLPKQQPVQPVRTAAQPDKNHYVEIQVPPSPSDVIKSNTAVCVVNESVRTVIVPSGKVVDLSSATTNCAGPLHRTEPCTSTTTTPSVGLPSVPMEARPMDNVGLLGKTPSYGGYTDGMDISRINVRGEGSPSPSISSVGSGPMHRADKYAFVMPRTTPSSIAGASVPMDSRQMDSTGILSKPPTYGGQPNIADSTRVLGQVESTSPCNQYSSPSSHRHIDWRNYKTYKEYTDNRRMYGCRTIQERLDCLRAASQNQTDYNQILPNRPSVQVRRRSTSHDRVPHPAQIRQRSISQERLEDPALMKDWPRSASQDAIPLPAMLPRSPKAKSWDFIARTGGKLDPYNADPHEYNGDRKHSYKWTGYTEQDDRRGIYERSRQHAFHMSLRSPNFQMGPVAYSSDSGQMNSRGLPSAHRFQKLPSDLKSTPISRGAHSSSFRSPHPQPVGGERLPLHKTNSVRGSSAYGPKPYTSIKKLEDGVVKDQKPINHVSGALNLQAMSPIDNSHSSHLDSTTKSPITSTPIPTKPVKQVTADPTTSDKVDVQNGQSPKSNDHEGSMEFSRHKSPSGRRTPQPIRQQSYIFAVSDLEGLSDTTCWLPNDARREVHIKRIEMSKAPIPSSPGDSLASIPFIDEPTSPSIDHEIANISASAVINISVQPPPTINTLPPSPTSTVPPLCRHLSHDNETLRPSALEVHPGSRTERSKSCDQGLDDFKEEEKVRNLKHLTNLQVLKAPGSAQSSEDSESRKGSSSDVFSDSNREGYLFFRQIITDKAKRIMKPWKQVYVILRNSLLYLHKDKKNQSGHWSSQSEEDHIINLSGCMADISYSDTKRKHAFRIITADHEYLFQAEDKDDMLDWIKAIRDNTNVDDEHIIERIEGFNTSKSANNKDASPKPSRQQSLGIPGIFGQKPPSPHSPKQDSERKLIPKGDTSPPKERQWKINIIKRDKKSSIGRTFGVRLDVCPPAESNKFVPWVVDTCCKLVEERGLENLGIYRVPGNNAAISSMQDELDKGFTNVDLQDDKWRDLNVISSLLKSFFRKLPEPLFTNDKYNDFIDANRKEDPNERLKTLRNLVRNLPKHHYQTLKFLCTHLKTVAENAEKNKMEPRNLALVFGPTLVRTSEDNMTHMVNHMPDQYKIVETLIQRHDWFFGEESGDDEPITTAQEEGTIDSQPLPNIDHLLPNIGRTGLSPGEISDSATSDSAKSKGSWGSGKDQYSRELLVSSIFAAASRKRRKQKDKPHPSSSEDEVDSVFYKKDLSPVEMRKPEARKGDTKKEGNAPRKPKALTLKDTDASPYTDDKLRKDSTPSDETAPCPPKPTKSPNLMHRLPVPPGEIKMFPSQESISDSGTVLSTSSQASMPKPKPNAFISSEVKGNDFFSADVSSVTSDYSTTSSAFYTAGLEPNISPEVQSVAESKGEDADDERSELISEGRPMETDSEGDSPSGGYDRQGKGKELCQDSRRNSEASASCTEGSSTPRMDSRLFSSHKLIECDTLSRKKSLRQKTDSECSTDGKNVESSAISIVVEAPSTEEPSSHLDLVKSDLGLVVKSEPEKQEPAWKLKITDRLKLRLKASADDMFGLERQKAHSAENRKKKNIRRRHTLGGQRDFADVSVLNALKIYEPLQGSKGPELSAMDRLKPKCPSQDQSISAWLKRERLRTSTSELNAVNPEESVLENTKLTGPLSSTLPSSSSQTNSADTSNAIENISEVSPQSSVDQINGENCPNKNKTSFSPTVDAHPHKLSGTQVVRSRFYQYL
ncbi:rho GTPase-activating protein 21 isoform X2 [Hyperolius riggenbachi]|uniref:rho GTPase-activating protein 21 isoform X2 n=1 Tax=Hyperolius riggenbachi TaxID=752182 RepID=UPI0035A2C201